jgi:hypothetical protein
VEVEHEGGLLFFGGSNTTVPIPQHTFSGGIVVGFVVFRLPSVFATEKTFRRGIRPVVFRVIVTVNGIPLLVSPSGLSVSHRPHS